jgi:DNA-binding NarL/FixJ family response regulator
MAPAKIRILIVDDHAVVREGLCALLRSEEDMEVVGEAHEGRQGVALALKTVPHVVLMDLSMPVLNGLDATRAILKRLPATRVLVLSSYRDHECVQKVIQSGAAGYLTKQTAAGELCRAIREVCRGRQFYTPDIAKILRDHERATRLPARGRLTDREIQVLQLISEGFPNKGIATELGISIKTVEKHRQSVMDKLNLHETAGLTRYAISSGIAPSPRKTETDSAVGPVLD